MIPHYLAIILAVAGTAVGICSIIVAIAQWKLAKQKLQFELFDRRMHAKEGVLGLADSYFREGKVTSQAYATFRKDAFNSRLHFPKNAGDWIREISDIAYKTMVAEGGLNRQLQSQAPDNEKIKQITEELEPLLGRIQKLYTEADEKLDQHIRLP